MSNDFVARLEKAVNLPSAHFQNLLRVEDLRALLDDHSRLSRVETIGAKVAVWTMRLERRASRWRALARARRQQVRDEQHDVQMLARIASKVFMEVTGGRVSKPNTDSSVVIELFEEYVQRLCDDVVKDETESLQAELATTQEALAKAQADIEHFKAELHKAKQPMAKALTKDAQVARSLRGTIKALQAELAEALAARCDK